MASIPLISLATQSLADGQASPLSRVVPSIAVGTGVPGLRGSNVTASPATSTAVHWLWDGHETEERTVPASTGPDTVGVVDEGPGSNVTSFPSTSTAVHALPEPPAGPPG